MSISNGSTNLSSQYFKPSENRGLISCPAVILYDLLALRTAHTVGMVEYLIDNIRDSSTLLYIVVHEQ